MPNMNKEHIISICIIILTFFMPACSNQTTPTQKKDTRQEEMSSMAGPPVIIYKTKMDFGKNVPVPECFARWSRTTSSMLGVNFRVESKAAPA